MCKSYHSTGFCPYGTRCHFIHNAEDIEKDSSEEDSLDVKPFEGLKIRYAIEHSTLKNWNDFRDTHSFQKTEYPSLNITLSLPNQSFSGDSTLKKFSAIRLIHQTGHQNRFPEIQIQILIQNLTLQNSKQNSTITWLTTTNQHRADQKTDYPERWKVVWQKIRLLLHLIRSDRSKQILALNRFGRIIILHR